MCSNLLLFFLQAVVMGESAHLAKSNPSPLAGLTANSSLPSQCPGNTAPASPPQSSHPKCPQIITSHSILFPSPALSQLETADLDSYFIEEIETIRKHLLLAPKTKFTKPSLLVPTSFWGQSPVLLISKDLTSLEVSPLASLTSSLLHSSHWPINKQ